MPVTQGHGNPDWTREETILALELLYKHGKPIDKKHSEVVALSDLLQHTNIHPVEKRTAKFRNPDGVALKLQNLFSAVEPGKGLSFSKTDLATVSDFPRSKSGQLSEIANAIREAVQGLQPVPIEEIVKEEVFVEGRWLTARHRQRDARLRVRLLEKHRASGLKCEVCDFSPPKFDRATQESFFEAHHKIPIATAEGQRITKVSDMALLCACCHRFIHRLISRERRWVSPSEARHQLDGAAARE